MKRLFLLIAVCMIGMVLPQGMWAETIYDQNDVTITIDNGTVTINCAKAGKLSKVSLQQGNPSLGNRIASCSTIKFEGYFCEDDINSLNQNNNHNYCTQSTVDMSEAHFVNDGGDENSHSNNYNSMSFQKWGSNVTTAITSTHMGPNDSASREFLNNCSNLTTLTLSSGKFPGLNGVDNLTTVTIKKEVTELGDGLFSGKKKIQSVEFETGGTNPLRIGNSCFNECFALQGNLTIPARTTSLGESAFNKAGSKDGGTQTGFNSINLTFESPCQITEFEESVFAYSGITSLTVPSSIKEIKTRAFDNCINLETVSINEKNEGTSLNVIRNQAFNGCDNLKEVWVNVDFSKHIINCEYNAFSFKSMDGQTNPEEKMTLLRFPENSFDFYAGEWKKGMAFSQKELNEFKDGIEIKDDQENVIYAKPDTQNGNFWSQTYGFSAIDHYTNVDGYYHDPNGGNTKYAPANGWQQFAKTSSKREVYVLGNVYMTYSDDQPHGLPKGILAFRVTEYKDRETVTVNGKEYTRKGKLVLKNIVDVPVNTGVLLISTNQYVVTNNEDRSKFYFGDPSVENPEQYPHEESNSDKLNYLVPAVSGVNIGPVSKGPYNNSNSFKLNGTSDFDHRNFGMQKNDPHQFVRLKYITMPDNRAFLSLPTTLFTNPNESATEGPSAIQTSAGLSAHLYDPNLPETSKASVFYDYNEALYGKVWPLMMNEEPAGITTGITDVNKVTAQDGIYTLQGVKVSAPNTKGIYIVNGKKVIIK